MKGFAFAKFATNSWGVAASVTKGTRFMGDGGLKLQPVYVEDRSFGETFLGPSETGDIQPVDITLGGQMRYEDHNYILEALALGSPAAVAISTSAVGQTTSWLHVFDPAPSIDGLGATFALDRKLYVEEITSAKIFGFAETIGDGGVVEQSFKVLGSKPTNVSSININSTVYGASYPALNGKIFRKQGTFRVNVQSGGALGASDAIPMETVDLDFERPQDRTFATGQDYIIEPGDNEFPLPSVKVGFPRMNTPSANSLYAALRAGTAYKGDWICAGAFINSTDQLTRKYQFPYMELQDFATPAAGAAQVKPQATWILKALGAGGSGMSGVTIWPLTRLQKRGRLLADALNERTYAA
jgi:hypothetical protein